MGWSDFNPFNVVEDIADSVSDFVSDFSDNPLGALGGLAEDLTKGTLSILTAGYSNKYDLGYWKDKFKPEVNPVYQGRKTTLRSSTDAREIIYGEVRTAGVLRYAGTSGAHDRYLNLIMLLADHPCEEITGIYFDDELVATPNGTAADDTQLFTIDAEYSSRMVAYAQLGNHTQQYSEITNAVPAEWTTNHKLLGCTFVHIRLQYDKKLFRRGVPQITFQVRGKNDIYDPRDLSTGYSNNHALCCLDYLRFAHGLNIADAEVDMQSFEDGANHCDVAIAQYQAGPTEPRYTCNGLIRIEGRPLDMLAEMQKAGAAFVVPTAQGIWRYIRAEYEAPVMSLNESDLVGGVEFSPGGSKDNRINTVAGVIISPDANWERAEYPSVSIPGYVTNDGEELSTQIDFNFVTSEYQAQRLARIAIERSRYGMTLSGIFKFKALQLLPGERITLSISKLGITNAVFVVVDTGLAMEGGVSLVLRQDAAAIYLDDPTDRSAIVVPNLTNLPNPDPVAPTNLAVSEELYSTNGGRDIKARAIVSWDEPADREQSYDVQFKPASASTWRNVETAVFGTEARKDDLAADTYDFRARAINSIGWEGDWVELLGVVFQGKTAPPPDVDSVSNDKNLLSWVYSSPPLDLAGFEVRYHPGTTQDWATGTKAHQGLVSATQFDVRDTLTATTTYMIKAVDTSGVYSTNSTNITTAPQANGDPVNWSDVVDDGNKPEDNATNGATWDSDITGQPADDQILNSLVDLSGWTAGGAMPPAGWTASGQAGENALIEADGPYGNNETIWRCTDSDTASNAEGGFHTPYVNIDPAKTYRFTCWVRRKDSQGGDAYLGFTADHLAIDIDLDATDGNPYFLGGYDTPTLDKWYLMVGYLYPHNTALTASEGFSGIYDPVTGQKVASGKDYKFDPNTTQVLLRAYFYYSTVIGERQDLARPRIDVINGQEPTLAQLLAGNYTDFLSAFTDDNQINVLNTQNAPAEAGATNGADFDVNLVNIPARITNTATPGLNLTDTHLGFYHASNGWQSYMDASGNFYLDGDANNYLSWNGTTLAVRGDIEATSIKAGAIDGETINGVSITGVTITGTSSITGATITGGTIQTAAPGNKRVVISGSTNDAQFYWDSGDGTVRKYVDIGDASTDDGSDYAIAIGDGQPSSTTNYEHGGVSAVTKATAMRAVSKDSMGLFATGKRQGVQAGASFGPCFQSTTRMGFGRFSGTWPFLINKNVTTVDYMPVVGLSVITDTYDNYCIEVGEHTGSSDVAVIGILAYVRPLEEADIFPNYWYHSNLIDTVYDTHAATHNLCEVYIAGVAPCRVNNSNGNISIGNSLRLTDGASDRLIRTNSGDGTGPTVMGKALAPYTSSTIGTIPVLLRGS